MAVAVRGDAPTPLQGFEHVKRYWDAGLQRHVAKILPGEFVVSTADELLVTVLGSCVSACIRDSRAGVGGMNHFMLPSEGGHGSWGTAAGLGLATRYGTNAMEDLINHILKLGGRRERLEIKVCGGGRMLEGMRDIGQRNSEFVREYVANEHLQILAEDLDGDQPRKVYYDPATGRMRVKYLKAMHNDTINRREVSYRHRLTHEPVEGTVDLF
jgi:chemotaxis protein CheD